MFRLTSRVLTFVCLTIGIISPVRGATITVNSALDVTADDGNCTLREAILSANLDNGGASGCAGGSGSDTIAFHISSKATTQTITLASPLPPITNSLLIDGYTEPGSIPNTLDPGSNAAIRVVIDGSAIAAGDCFAIAPGAIASLVRGLAISNCPGSAISVRADSVTITGNFIGTDALGGTAAPNGRVNQAAAIDAVSVANLRIGMSAPSALGERNVISGNAGPSISVVDSISVEISGNVIGVVRSGTGSAPAYGSLPNAGAVVITRIDDYAEIGNGPDTLAARPVTCTGLSNVIGGSADGIRLTGPNSGYVVVGENCIGTDATGLHPLAPGAGSGVVIQTGIGKALVSRNVVSGWNVAGVDIDDVHAGFFNDQIGAVLQSNLIGADGSGFAALGNGQYGVRIHSSNGVQVLGGVISGNLGYGIYVDSSNTINVDGAFIGLAADGWTPLPNRRNGVHIAGATSAFITIGGFGRPTTDWEFFGNRIAYNGADEPHAAGVSVLEGNFISINGNWIYENRSSAPLSSSIGIDLGGDGPTANDDDACDADEGPNDLLNFPTLISVTGNRGNTRIEATTRINVNYPERVDIYSNRYPGNQGGRPLGAVYQPAYSACNTTFENGFAGRVIPGELVTATTEIATRTSELSPPFLATVPAWVMGDLDGNGTADLLLRNTITRAIGVWNLTNGTITGGAVLPTTGEPYKVLGTGDLDGDGRADILVRVRGVEHQEYTNKLRALMSTSAGFAEVPVAGFTEPLGVLPIAAIADFNGDGKADLLGEIPGDPQGHLYMYLMDGASVTGSSARGASDVTGSALGTRGVVGAADFNGDGKADILLRDRDNNLFLLTMDGKTITADQLIGTMPAGYSVAAVGDLNGNGKADIVLRDVNGTIGVWFMDGSTVSSGAFIGQAAGYVVAGIGDFNHDGREDLLLRHLATGNLGVWFMNGATVTGGTFVGSLGTAYDLE